MNPVNLFFACDNAYVPFLAVTLTSLKENCNPKRDYALRILHTGLDPENIRRLTDSFASDGFTMEFIDITQAVEQFADKLHTRDYYSKSTYYRLFIPDLFPGLDGFEHFLPHGPLLHAADEFPGHAKFHVRFQQGQPDVPQGVRNVLFRNLAQAPQLPERVIQFIS